MEQTQTGCGVVYLCCDHVAALLYPRIERGAYELEYRSASFRVDATNR
jgi:hypothetical protein